MIVVDQLRTGAGTLSHWAGHFPNGKAIGSPHPVAMFFWCRKCRENSPSHFFRCRVDAGPQRNTSLTCLASIMMLESNLLIIDKYVYIDIYSMWYVYIYIYICVYKYLSICFLMIYFFVCLSIYIYPPCSVLGL